jgi:hypothetical protein
MRSEALRYATKGMRLRRLKVFSGRVRESTGFSNPALVQRSDDLDPRRVGQNSAGLNRNVDLACAA